MTADSTQDFEFKLTSLQLWGLTLLTAIGYILYSKISDGFYQHDEAAHFLNMRRFWFDPSVILGNWAKPGYKIVFAPVSLLGSDTLIIVNSFLSAFTCFMAYKLSEAIDSKIPFFAFLLLAIQPFWIQLSFRNYSEVFTAFLLITSVWGHYKKKYWITALLISYTTTIRQEMYPLLGLYSLFLLYKKNWLSIFLLITFPVINNIAGWFYTGDPFYLLSSMLGTSESIQDAYPRLGFAHYFKMSLTIFGGVTLTFFLSYLYQVIFFKKKSYWFILAPILIYFFLHVFFSIRFLKLGPSTGGNLRYLIVVSPLIAVLGGLALERIGWATSQIEKKKLYYLLLPFAWLVLVFLTFEHDNVRFLFNRDYSAFVPVALSIILVSLGLKEKKFIVGFILISVISGIIIIRPINLNEEDQLVKKFVEWGEENGLTTNPILANHTMFYYWSGKVPEEFENGAGRINSKTVRLAEPGSYIIWDSHYTYRPRLREGTLDLEYFTSREEEFQMVREPMKTKEGYFSIYLFEKITE